MSGPVVLLASASPRRRDLLAAAGIAFRAAAPEVEEQHRPPETAAAYAARNARAKADWACAHAPLAGVRAVLAADTVVVLGGHLLEKPRDAAEAAAMLGRLSGRRHDVVTGVCLYRVEAGRAGERRTFVETTAVRFRVLAPDEIAAYVATGEPMDKAGAYAIQGEGGALVAGITGSHANVVGLPVERVAAVLAEWTGGDR